MKRLLAILLASCLPGPIQPPRPIDATDAETTKPLDAAIDEAKTSLESGQPWPHAIDVCAELFKHLVNDVGCMPRTPASGSFADACRVGRAAGVFGTSCMFKARTVADVAKCGLTCTKEGGS